MRIACISDTHGKYKNIDWPEADVLVMAGDLLPNFFRISEKDALNQLDYIVDQFYDILHDLTYKNIIVVPGNHDWAFEKYTLQCINALNSNKVHVLIDKSFIIDGIKFYGSPWQTWFHNWSFNFPKNDLQVAYNTWQRIPSDVNVLVVHGPPFGILDECADGQRVGCPMLAKRIPNLSNMKLAVYGHIHESYGSLIDPNGITHINASLCDLHYNPVNPVQVFEW